MKNNFKKSSKELLLSSHPLFTSKYSENHRLSDDFRRNKTNQSAQIRPVLVANSGENPLRNLKKCIKSQL